MQMSQLNRTMFTSKVAQDSIGLNKPKIAVLQHWKLSKWLQL